MIKKQSQEGEEKKSKSLKERVQDAENSFKKFGRTIANKWEWYDINYKSKIVGFVAVGLTAYILGIEKFIAQPLKERENLAQATQEVLFKYGDINKDVYVSQEERDVLFAEILKDKSVKCISGERPVYENGKEVTKKELTDWINDYMNSR